MPAVQRQLQPGAQLPGEGLTMFSGKFSNHKVREASAELGLILATGSMAGFVIGAGACLGWSFVRGVLRLLAP